MSGGAGGADLMAMAVPRAAQARVVAQRAAVVFGTEQSASLRFRHDEADEIVEALGLQMQDRREPVGAPAANHSSNRSATVLATLRPERVPRSSRKQNRRGAGRSSRIKRTIS
jgi:hypothetical protein